MLNAKDILYEDESMIVVHKQPKIAVQSARSSQMDLEHMVLNELAMRKPDGKKPYLAVIHRLDQPVEGIVVFGKTPEAAAGLSRQIQNNQMEKYYLALVDGHVVKQKERLENYLKKDYKNNVSSVVSADTPDAKKAVLEYEKVAVMEDGYTLVKIHLLTGRHHQIRVQMAHAGMPLVGDVKYHSKAERDGKIALCAFYLSFNHPKTKKKMEFKILPVWAQNYVQ